MLLSGKEIPRNTSVVGVAKIQGERLNVLISSLEYHGNIIPVELAVYDTDWDIHPRLDGAQCHQGDCRRNGYFRRQQYELLH